jgi:hypothetical protein
MAGVVNGTDLRLSVGGNPIAYATSCTLDYTAETRETVSKDSAGNGWKSVEVGQLGATLSIESLYTEDVLVSAVARENTKDLFDAFAGKTLVTWEFTTGVSTETKYSGSGYFTSGSITGAAEENATSSHTIAVDGAVTSAAVA